MSTIIENDPVEFEISPEYNGKGIVREITYMNRGEDDGYFLYTVEDNDGTIWTLHKDRINNRPAFDNYNRAMQGV